MHINIPRSSDIRYNAAEECFEALISVRDARGRYDYATQVKAGLGTDADTIKTALIEAARRMHLAPVKGMHLHYAPGNSAEDARLAA